MYQFVLMIVLAAAVKVGQATIKSVAVAGPVVGSQSTFGRVDLTAPATQPVVITLLTGNIKRGVPESVTVAPGQSMQTFVIKTEPVAALTTVTLTARTSGSPDATATFNVIPPNLSILDCEPKSVPGGEHATCKAWMDGLVASGATPQIALSSSNSQVVSFDQPSVTVPAGSRWVTFFAYGRDLPQSATATVSATYAGITKSSNLTVTPAAIKNFGCVVGAPETAYGSSQCSVVGGDFDPLGYHRNVGWAVHLTAPAPPSGYKIPLEFSFAAPPNANGEQPPSNPLNLEIPKTLEVPAGKDHGFYTFHTTPAEHSYIIKVTAKDPITRNAYDTELTVNPPRLKGAHFDSSSITAVPLGGKDVYVRVEFQSDPPQHGIAYDVTYAGTTDIKGPARVRIDPPDYSRIGSFTVKVFPCAINPPCTVSVTLGSVPATATVKP